MAWLKKIRAWASRRVHNDLSSHPPRAMYTQQPHHTPAYHPGVTPRCDQEDTKCEEGCTLGVGIAEAKPPSTRIVPTRVLALTSSLWSLTEASGELLESFLILPRTTSPLLFPPPTAVNSSRTTTSGPAVPTFGGATLFVSAELPHQRVFPVPLVAFPLWDTPRFHGVRLYCL